MHAELFIDNSLAQAKSELRALPLTGNRTRSDQR